MSIMDREKLPAHARARLAEEEKARATVGPLFKDGKAVSPNGVTTPASLPARWYGVFEHELVMRLSNVVPYDETRRYALEVTVAAWRKELARKRNKKNHPRLWENA
jgi:hypothetical protein